ncbi:MAG TPA: DUF3237 family protein [Ktedonobacteraceae bacterium]|nr:DUF3237 family protein [Ktedonobacteraceae bacterium]
MNRTIIPPELSDDLTHPVKRAAVDPSRYYFHTCPILETGSKKYPLLTQTMSLSKGYFFESSIGYRIFRIH